MLIAQGRNSLYLGYGKDCRKVNLQDVPVEHLVLEEPKAYQEHAVFYHRPSHISDLNGQNPLRPVPEREFYHWPGTGIRGPSSGKESVRAFLAQQKLFARLNKP